MRRKTALELFFFYNMIPRRWAIPHACQKTAAQAHQHDEALPDPATLLFALGRNRSFASFVRASCEALRYLFRWQQGTLAIWPHKDLPAKTFNEAVNAPRKRPQSRRCAISTRFRRRPSLRLRKKLRD